MVLSVYSALCQNPTLSLRSSASVPLNSTLGRSGLELINGPGDRMSMGSSAKVSAFLPEKAGYLSRANLSRASVA